MHADRYGLRKESKTSKVEKKHMHLDHGLTKESRPSTVELVEMSHILMSLATSFAAKSSGDTSFVSFSPLFSLLFSPFLLRFFPFPVSPATSLSFNSAIAGSSISPIACFAVALSTEALPVTLI